MLGFSKNFSSNMVGYWSSGTGMAGLFGSGVYISLTALSVPKFYVKSIIQLHFLIKLDFPHPRTLYFYISIFSLLA